MTYKIIRSKRKTVCLRWRPDGILEVRCPIRLTAAQVDDFVRSKAGWIEKHRPRSVAQPLTEDEIALLRRQAKLLIPQRVAYYAQLLGVTYGQISIRGQKTRWGSCSAKGNLNFNYLLMLAPPEALDYVVIHELCHRKQMNHSKAFWQEVEQLCPNYQQLRKWLRQNGNSLLSRLPGEK